MTGSYREKTNEAKAARRGITEQPTGANKNKHPRLFVVEYRTNTQNAGPWMLRLGLKAWTGFGKHRTEEEAQSVMDNQRRKSDFYEFRLKP